MLPERRNTTQGDNAMSIVFKHKGDLSSTTKFLKRAKTLDIRDILEKYGKEGVNKLASVTPKDTGRTAASWNYFIEMSNGTATITWTNSSKDDGGVPIVILLEYGHGTPSGYYVKPRNFVKPAMKPILDKIAKEAWEEVTKV